MPILWVDNINHQLDLEIMALKTGPNETLNMKKGKFQKEISSIKDSIIAYKAERKASWKSFKKKTNDEIDLLNKSINKLTVAKKKE